MKTILIAGIAAAAFCGAPAFAADMPVKSPPIATMFNWSGYYAGVNGGYAWDDGVGPITFTNGIPQSFTTTRNTFDAKGGFGGGQIGYNWQSGRTVFGVETDIQAAAIKSKFSGATVTNGFADIYGGSRKLDYFGTVRGRIGLAFDRTLLYATGGFAYGGLNENITRENGTPLTLSKGGVRTGYVLGGGVEYALSPVWTIKAEYQYIDFGGEIIHGTYTLPAGLPIQTNSISDHYSTVRVGLNYLFGSR